MIRFQAKFFVSLCFLLLAGSSHASSMSAAWGKSQSILQDFHQNLDQLQHEGTFISPFYDLFHGNDIKIEATETEEETEVSISKKTIHKHLTERAVFSALALQMYFRMLQPVPFHFEPLKQAVTEKRFVVFQDFRI